MMAMTTNSSINVNPRRWGPAERKLYCFVFEVRCWRGVLIRSQVLAVRTAPGEMLVSRATQGTLTHYRGAGCEGQAPKP